MAQPQVTLQTGKKSKEDQQGGEPSPFNGLQKNVVVREARIFNDQQLKPNRCALVLTKILYLITQGEEFKGEEATELFFACTKLFQSQDVHLRRMVFLAAKELKVGSDESLILVACLNKDMTSKTDLFRANAIRVLAKIVEPTMLVQIERFLKQALVDKNPFIVSSTLVAGAQQLTRSGTAGADVVRRWLTEIQEALNSKSRMVQYHALSLLHRLKHQDRLAISKIVSALVKSPPKGSLSQCLHIRILSTVAGNPTNPEFLRYLVECLHSSSSMVMFEAARAICRIESLTALQVSPAIAVLQEFLSSPIGVQRFAAVRALNEVVVRFPYLLTPCRPDLEHLLADPNRTVATLAITALLKTGIEANVERLMKTITSFMGEISDDFKIVLVDAIKALCLKFPQKYQIMMSFLSQALREEGGFKYKKAIVEAMLSIIATVQESKETGLDQFCEYIEDCEFPELSIKILHLLGQEGPTTATPAKFIRYIFNRVILETASVRAAAVSALARFGAAVPALTDSVIVLLQRCLNDNDDEVRDRAVYMLNVLKHGRPYASSLFTTKLPCNLPSLEASLQSYLDGTISAPFNLAKDLKQMPDDDVKDEKGALAAAAAAIMPNVEAKQQQPETKAAETKTAAKPENPHLELLNSIDEIKALGPIFKSCPAVELTESETEYVVSCVKHLFPQHIVFQFNVMNNMEGQQLENVQVEMEAEKDEWQEEFVIPEENKLGFQAKGVTFVCFSRAKGSFSSGSMTCTLKFQTRELSSTGEASSVTADDEYQLEDVEVTESDFMKPDSGLGLPDFRRHWETLGESQEIVKKFSLQVESLPAAVKAVLELLGMEPIADSHVVADDARSHAMNLAGIYFGNVPVYVRAGFLLDQKQGVTLKIAVRSQDAGLRNLLINVIK